MNTQNAIFTRHFIKVFGADFAAQKLDDELMNGLQHFRDGVKTWA